MPTRQITVTTSDGAGHETTRTVSYEVSDEQVNDETIRQQAAAALAANRAFVTQAKPSTASAQASQAYDQTVKLSRQNNGLIRLLLGQLDGTD